LTGLTPPAPSSVTATHPLLVRHDEPRTVTNPVIGTILHRSGRERDTYRYNPNTQTLHVQRERMRRPNPSAVLQRYRCFAWVLKTMHDIVFLLITMKLVVSSKPMTTLGHSSLVT